MPGRCGFLDTEQFMHGESIKRRGFDSLSVLCMNVVRTCKKHWLENEYQNCKWKDYDLRHVLKMEDGVEDSIS